MARASLRSTVRGTHHSSYGDNARRRHDRLSVTPTSEPEYVDVAYETYGGVQEFTKAQDSLARMMRDNRAAGL